MKKPWLSEEQQREEADRDMRFDQLWEEAIRDRFAKIQISPYKYAIIARDSIKSIYSSKYGICEFKFLYFRRPKHAGIYFYKFHHIEMVDIIFRLKEGSLVVQEIYDQELNQHRYIIYDKEGKEYIHGN